VIYSLPSFDRARRRLSPVQESALGVGLRRLEASFGRPHLHGGLGLRSFGRYFEFRVGLQLRGLFLADSGDIFLVTVGTHDDLRNYLKNNR
jgi:hypothetical protein